MEELDKETKAKVSELKGPQTDVKQDDVDDLLSQLGLD
jgi:chemotaxis protein CheZ